MQRTRRTRTRRTTRTTRTNEADIEDEEDSPRSQQPRRPAAQPQMPAHRPAQPWQSSPPPAAAGESGPSRAWLEALQFPCFPPHPPATLRRAEGLGARTGAQNGLGEGPDRPGRPAAAGGAARAPAAARAGSPPRRGCGRRRSALHEVCTRGPSECGGTHPHTRVAQRAAIGNGYSDGAHHPARKVLDADRSACSAQPPASAQPAARPAAASLQTAKEPQRYCQRPHPLLRLSPVSLPPECWRSGHDDWAAVPRGGWACRPPRPLARPQT